MKTPIILTLGTAASGPSNTATRYCGFAAGQVATVWKAAASDARTPIVRAGSLSDLVVRFPAALSAGTSYAITLMVNGVASALTCTIDDTGLVASDHTHSVSVADTDDVCWRVVPTGTPAAQGVVDISCVFTSTSAGQSVLFGYGATTAAAQHFRLGCMTPVNLTEANAKIPLPAPGSIGKMRVMLGNAPGVGNSRTLTLYKNGSPTSLTVNIADNATAGSIDLGGSPETFAQGDLVSVAHAIGNAPATGVVMFCTDWTPTTDGQALLLVGASGSVASGTAVFWNASGASGANESSESVTLAIAPVAFTLQNMSLAVTTAPGSGKSRAVTLRKGDGTTQTDQALTIAVNDAETADNDNTHTVAVAANDIFNLKSTPSGTPTAPGACSVGMVAYIAPAGVVTHKRPGGPAMQGFG